ncbi:MAG: fasciclin domain-containing protein [Acidimicrobiales bacterium]|nr:fasciclin domain-containing protein [Acidimicrobiales bacterium]
MYQPRTPSNIRTAPLRLFWGLLALALVASACGGEDGPPARSGAAFDAGPNLVQLAQSDAEFSTLVDAVVTADLVGTLSGTDEFTVFAPTNDAFEATLSELGITAEQLLADKAQLTDILLNHVTPGVVLADQVIALDGGTVTTVFGDRLAIDGTSIGGANLTATDLLANNGVIHVIDSVLLPSPAASGGGEQ